MVFNPKRFVLSGALLVSLPLSAVVFAATPVDLNQQTPATYHSILARNTYNAINMVETGRSTFKDTLHIHFQQTYQGIKVWNGDGVIHVKNAAHHTDLSTAVNSVHAKGDMDGVIYQNLAEDLKVQPKITHAQEASALQHAVKLYQDKANRPGAIADQQNELVVYVDDNNIAHWVYHVSFTFTPAQEGVMPAKPSFLLDANTMKVYQQWDEIKTIENEATLGGGYGGNKKMGKVTYDGLQDHLPALKVSRDGSLQTCFLQNDDVTVKGYRTKKIVSFDCKATDPEHNSVYWSDELEAVNEGYSPPNDALFGGMVIKDMYHKWYNLDVLTQNGKPMMLTMVVHDPIDNAYWDGRQMTFGDGVNMFYPLTSLGVAAHEISHGFTEQHSGLRYYGQSGGMNEAFSDMAAQAAEMYAYGKNSWQIGPEIFKAKDQALRYMDQPSKDCNGKTPGDWCSIDTAAQYYMGLDVHFSSGVYNHFFYALGTSEGWTVRKAFDVMLGANMNYWASSTNFSRGACGVIKAAKDLGYSTEDVKKAFKVVEIDTKNC